MPNFRQPPQARPVALMNATTTSCPCALSLFNAGCMRSATISLINPCPPSWQSSKLYLLYKKGNRQLPINYRPISLLGVVYKIIASHLTTSLADLANTHDLIHHSQVGGMANRRCSDHIWHLLALRSRDAHSPPDAYPHGYHLYADFNKAFNSVPRKALRAALEKYNLPTWLVESILHLYDARYEHPAVNG